MTIADWFTIHKRIIGMLAIWGACLVILGVFTESRLSTYYKKQAAAKAEEAKELKAKIAKQTLVIQAQDKTIDAQEVINDVLSKKYAAALVRVPTAPPKPVPAPSEASQLARDLAGYGLCAPTVGQVSSTSLTGVDAQHVWEWHSEWVRMPGVETTLAGTQVALQDCDKLQKGLATQVSNYAVQVGNLDTKYALLTKETDAEKASLGYTIKELKTDKRGLTIKIVVLVPAAAYIGYRLGHH